MKLKLQITETIPEDIEEGILYVKLHLLDNRAQMWLRLRAEGRTSAQSETLGDNAEW